MLQSVKAQFPMFSGTGNQPRQHYLDNAATTFCPTPVIDAMLDFETCYRANVGRGTYRLARMATAAYEDARATAGTYLGTENTDEIVFTSGTTAAINMLAAGLGPSLRADDEVLVSRLEHHSNLLPWQNICQKRSCILKYIPVDNHGALDYDSIEQLVSRRTRIISVTHASNVTGEVVQIDLLSEIARNVGAKLVVDGAQMAAQGPVNPREHGADFYVFSGHKCYGPTGIGVLWGRADAMANLSPLMLGGGMVENVTEHNPRYLEGCRRFEAGTPPIGPAIALGAALQWIQALPLDTIHARNNNLLELLTAKLKTNPGTRLLGPPKKTARVPIISFQINGFHSHDICDLLDEYGIAVRGGHHCAQPLIDHLGITGATRVSLAAFNNLSDVNAFLHGLNRALDVLQ